jgi:hypothetical protein
MVLLILLYSVVSGFSDFWVDSSAFVRWLVWVSSFEGVVVDVQLVFVNFPLVSLNTFLPDGIGCVVEARLVSDNSGTVCVKWEHAVVTVVVLVADEVEHSFPFRERGDISSTRSVICVNIDGLLFKHAPGQTNLVVV